jgi:N-methylhydantoinase B
MAEAQVRMPAIDAVHLEVLRNKFQAITEEICHTLQRTSHTVFVNETADFSTGLSSVGGELFAYPQSIGVSVMVNADLSDAIAAFPEYAEGDVVITNDPYTSGSLASHLPDTNLFKPVIVDGEPIAFVWAYVHSTDVGGRVPGSVSPTAGDVFQEGVRLAPCKLYRAGELDQQVLRTVLDNCRVPADNWGDIKAVVAALNIGEQRLKELVERHGAGMLSSSIDEVLAYAERRARDLFEQVPDGTYEFTDLLDDDVATDDPVRLHVAVEVSGGEVTLDLTGCDVQSMAALNIPSFGRAHPWIAYRLISFLYSLDRNVPVNGGLLRPVDVRMRTGSIVNCEFPAAIGLRTTTSMRLMDAVQGALSKAMPGTLPAASGGLVVPVVAAELDFERGGRRVLTVEPLVGGTGAGAELDGVDGRDVGLANLRNTPIEIVEAETSLVIRDYSLACDTGGAGRRRGGTGVVLELEAHRPDTVITARGMERQVFRPWGAHGGAPGARALAVLNPGTGSERVLRKIETVTLHPGDVLRIQTAGGGGYGSPFEREPERVLADVARGVVSVEGARRDYGVVVVDGAVDVAATAAEREARGQPAQLEFDMGPERLEYDETWRADLSERLLEILYALPTAARAYVKGKLMATVRERRAGEPAADALERGWRELRDSVGIEVA